MEFYDHVPKEGVDPCALQIHQQTILKTAAHSNFWKLDQWEDMCLPQDKTMPRLHGHFMKFGKNINPTQQWVVSSMPLERKKPTQINLESYDQ